MQKPIYPILSTLLLLVCSSSLLFSSTAKAQDGPLELAMTAGPDPAQPGELVTYEVTVANQEEEELSGVTVQNVLPAHMDYFNVEGVSCPGGRCDSGETLTWEVGTLSGGQSRTLTYTARLLDDEYAPPDGTVISSSASVVSGSGATASAPSDVRIDATPALTLNLSEDRDPARPGETVTYTLTYGNPSSRDLSDVRMRAPVPPGASFASASGGGQVSGDAVEWSLGSLEGGESAQQTFAVTVGSGAGDGDLLEGRATVREAGSSEMLARAEAATVVQSEPAVALSMISLITARLKA